MQNIGETILEEGFVHAENLDKGKVRLISLIAFVLSFSQAIFAYMMSSYFKLASGTENVGAFYFIAYIVVLIILLNMHKIIRKIGKSRMFLFSVLAKIVFIFALSVLPASMFSTIFLVGYIILGSLVWVDLDAMLECFSQDNLSGRIRGLYLVIMNLGYLLGPFLATQILDRYSYQGIFLLMLLLNAGSFIVGLVGLKNVNHKFEQRVSVRELVKKVFRRSDVMQIYYISFILDFFYALMVIYTPIYLLNSGISWDKIGIIFTIMLIPFVLLQYPAGFLADKKMGEKELLIFSIILMGASTFALFFIRGDSLTAWAVALFVTRIGAALIEILRDSYFYKRIDGHDVDIINFFRTSSSVGYIVATAISMVLLLFLPIKAVFILVGIAVLSALVPALQLNDNKCEAEMSAECKNI